MSDNSIKRFLKNQDDLYARKDSRFVTGYCSDCHLAVWSDEDHACGESHPTVPATEGAEKNHGININAHPLIRQSYEVSLAIEECGASEQQTNAGIKSSALTTALSNLLDDDNYVAFLRWAGDTQHRHLVLCNSDDERAFKVYRWPLTPQAAPQPPAKWIRQESCSQCDGDGCNMCEPPADAEEIARKCAEGLFDNNFQANLTANTRLIVYALTDYAKPLVERIGELEREYGILERTVQHMEKSYLAEHGTWGNCTWRLKAQVAETRADSLAETLRWLDRLGGLGLDKHERIRAALASLGPVAGEGKG